MQFKKWIALVLAATMLLAGLAGCKTTTNEESAQADGFVEGTTQSTESENSTPAVRGEGKVTYETTQKPSTGDNEKENGDTPVDNSGTAQKPEKEDSSAKDPVDNGSEKEEPETSQPEAPEKEEETPKTEEDKEDEPEPEPEPEPTPGTSDSSSSGNTLKIISYNIRYGNDGNGRSVKERAPRLKKVIDEYDPDIIGFQEVTPLWLPYLIDDYASDYSYYHKYRSANDKEGAPIFWKADKFVMLDSGSFWLSETPDVESKGWNGSHVRMAMWVKLQVKSTGKEFLFINTHYDSGSTKARDNSPALVIERMKALGGFTKYPVIFTADCNAKPNSTCYKEMCKAFADVNASLSNDKTPTFTNYGSQTGSIIDYCFYSPGLVTPQKYQVIKGLINGNYVSDHSGVFATVTLE